MAASAVEPPVLTVVLSPYHLTSREPAAMASLLLADRAVTMVPTPRVAETDEDVRRRAVEDAAARTPRYIEAMESWAWAAPLFRSGVLGAAASGEDPADDVRVAWERLNDAPEYAELRPLMKAAMYDDDAAYLGAVAHDLLKGGPDPAVSIPVAAGLDAFASRHGLAVARAASKSVAQRAEDRLARKLASFAVPVLVQADGHRVELVREILAEALVELRDAVLDVFEGDGSQADVRAAAGRFEDAFERNAAGFAAPVADSEEVRVITGVASVTLVELPADAVMRSSVSAARAYGGRPARRGSAGASGGGAALATSAGVCRSIVVKLMGRG